MVLENLFSAFGQVANLSTMAFLIGGLLIGILVGGLPGIGPGVGMAIVLPLTLPFNDLNAIILLIAIYAGGMYGGSITAILINVPGTASAAATTFDGYPLSRKGKAKDALAISAVSSGIGGIITMVLLFIISPLLVEVVLAFESVHYFLVAMLGIAMITIIARGSLVKGLVAGAFGLLLSTVGVAPIQPVARFTLGSLSLYNGISFIAALVGIFAVTEMLILTKEGGSISDTNSEMGGSLRRGIKTAVNHPITIIKSSLIGMAVGAIPGSGASVSNFLAYGEAVRSSEDPDSFGNGNPSGVVASESSNNATVGGSLVPTLSFGIPGSASTAVFLGGLITHGFIPGPELFSSQLSQTYAMFSSLVIGNILIILIGLLLVTHLSFITKINTYYLIPFIIVLATLGALGLRSNWFDVFTIFVIGVIGYTMRKYNYSAIGFVLGVVLGPIAEQNLLRALQISGGSFGIFISDPLAILLDLILLVVLVGPFVSRYIPKSVFNS